MKNIYGSETVGRWIYFPFYESEIDQMLMFPSLCQGKIRDVDQLSLLSRSEVED
jgi:hypothetical protein